MCVRIYIYIYIYVCVYVHLIASRRATWNLVYSIKSDLIWFDLIYYTLNSIFYLLYLFLYCRRGAVLKAINTLPPGESRAIHERLGLGTCCTCCMYMYMYLYIYVYLYEHMHILTYSCRHICIHIYVHVLVCSRNSTSISRYDKMKRLNYNILIKIIIRQIHVPLIHFNSALHLILIINIWYIHNQ